jgi:long-chain acyl-CoA synthetase
MEATAELNRASSNTIADLALRAARSFGDRVAQRHKTGGEWRDITFAELGEIVSELARGLIELGIERGERVCILCTTRVEWVWCSFAVSAAGGVVVPIYPTNSAEECAWVIGNSEAVAIICEDDSQVAKIDAVRDRLPELRHVVGIDGAGGVTLDALRARGRALPEAELEDRTRRVTKTDPYTFIYTSGTTGPPKGCVLSHGNYVAMLDMVAERGVVGEGPDELIYLFLPTCRHRTTT